MPTPSILRIKPGYSNAKAVLYNADCRGILPLLIGIDAIVTDPPYGLGEAAGRNKSRSKAATAMDYGVREWDNEPASKACIDLMRSVSKWQIIFGGNYFEVPPSSCWLVWDKERTGDFADCGLAWTNLPGAVRLVKWTYNGRIRKDKNVEAPRTHPTQKPEGVMEWCISKLPDDVQTVCDPYMGSGTTGVAALRAGKRFIGIEREADYFETARSRILFQELGACEADPLI